ncbi:hypothetical protein [Glaciibacter psychrotolerans]|uniref:Uncharacterized protein n=1 Tax=Glaciibacter psychrotolerans TaxID=670054 RepID=A0A7Z0J6W1_9MICO|nr:hypothetical protein [Leifsonia psychrotolerans]NYJ20348.1 hypothetical protein [Leifsonia psychrotolerans]
MESFWPLLCLALALGGTGLSMICALAALRGPTPRPLAVVGAAVMVVSTVDMVLPGVSLLPALGWAAVLLGTVLVSVLVSFRVRQEGGGRLATAQHSAGLLLMVVMWLAMVPTSLPTRALAGLAQAATSTDAGHAAHLAYVGGGAVPLGWGMLAASVALILVAVRAAPRIRVAVHRSPRAARSSTRPSNVVQRLGHDTHGAGRSSIARRLGALQHASMAWAMGAMTAGMVVPGLQVPGIVG